MNKEGIMKKLDILSLILFPAIAVFVSLYFKTNFLISTLLFFGLPSLWFSFRALSKVKKTFLFTLALLPLGLFGDYIAISNGAWLVPLTMFPFRLFDIIPIEDLILGIFLAYNIVIFYEHFLDKGKHELTGKRMKYFLWMTPLLIVLFIGVLVKPTLLIIPYSYLWLGVVCVLLPSVIFLFFFPKLLSKYIKTASYFSLLLTLFELTGLRLNQWIFPGNDFIGWVELLGCRFPFEELIFWIVFASIVVLSYYEFFDDDRK